MLVYHRVFSIKTFSIKIDMISIINYVTRKFFVGRVGVGGGVF